MAASTETFNYTGFKLGEKKGIKAKESHYTAALQKLQAAMGADFQIEVDWSSFNTGVPLKEGSGYQDRDHLGGYLYERYCTGVSKDLVEMCKDADTKEALLGALTAKKIRLTCDQQAGDKTVFDGRCKFSIDAGVFTITLNPKSLAYDYEGGKKYLEKTL